MHHVLKVLVKPALCLESQEAGLQELLACPETRQRRLCGNWEEASGACLDSVLVRMATSGVSHCRGPCASPPEDSRTRKEQSTDLPPHLLCPPAPISG